MANGNGDFAQMISRLLDEKLRPIQSELGNLKQLVLGLQGSIKHMNVRLMVIEDYLGIDPDKPKH